MGGEDGRGGGEGGLVRDRGGESARVGIVGGWGVVGEGREGGR